MKRWQGITAALATYALIVWASGWVPERGTNAVFVLFFGVWTFVAAAAYPCYRGDDA